jgi:hypothetical protein
MKTATLIFTVQSLVCGALAILFPSWAILFVPLTGVCGAAAGYWFCMGTIKRSQQQAIQHFFMAVADAAKAQDHSDTDKYTVN